MKKIYYIFATLVLFGASSKVKADNSNGMFVDTKTPNHIVVENDVKQIAYYIDRNEIVAGKWYTLKSGFTFKMDNPSLWKSTMTDVLTSVKGSTVTSIRQEFDSIQILDWDDNISVKTMNYNMKGGKLGYSDDYSGGAGVRVATYKGYPVLKVGKPCFNPNKPKSKKSANSNLDKGLATTPEVETPETETSDASDQPCYKEVWKEQRYYEDQTFSYRDQSDRGWYTGYYGFDNGYRTYTKRVWKTRKVKVLVPCEEVEEASDEELPVASSDPQEEEVSKDRVRNRMPLYIFINGAFVFNKMGYTLGNYQQQQLGGPGGPGSRGGLNGGPGGPGSGGNGGPGGPRSRGR